MNAEHSTLNAERRTGEAPPTWHKDNPPKDGTSIVAIGRLIYEEEGCMTTVEPFCAVIHWSAAVGQYIGWHYRDGLAVPRTPDDEVMLDAWIEYPVL